ncbi:hypothetical protein L9F63_000853, partial [Diploptera punctata]
LRTAKPQWRICCERGVRSISVRRSCSRWRKNGGTNSVKPTVVKAPRDRRKFNHQASDFTYVDDWPTLGEKKNQQISVPTPKQNGHVKASAGSSSSSTASGSSSNGISGNERAKVPSEEKPIQNGTAEELQHVAGAEAAERRKRNPKQKWVPLDIDLAKSRGKGDRSPKYHGGHYRERNGDYDYHGRDDDGWRSSDGLDRGGHHFRGGRGGPRYRGRGGRGGGRGLGRGGYRRGPAHNDTEYPDYPTEYTQVNKFGLPSEQSAYMMPYMGTYYYDNNSYMHLDEPTLKEYIRKQIEYYFSEENLLKDVYMRRKMDDEGYIPITLIVSFHRMKALSTDHMVVADAIKDSEVLELNDFKVRTKLNPTKWPLADPTPAVPAQGPGGLPFHVPSIPPLPHISSFKTFPFSAPPPLTSTKHRFQNGNIETISDSFHLNDHLNPDVPEFIPVTVRLKEETAKDDMNLLNNHEESIEPEKTVAIPLQKNSSQSNVNGEHDSDSWKEVKRRVKPPPKDKEEKKGREHFEEREELDFQFDEELDNPVPSGRHNTFTDWSEDESDYELSDHEINKILIVTQATSQSSRYPKHEGYDRTGDWTTRVKITQDLEQVISDGLSYYEDGLWTEHDRLQSSGNYKTVNIITQEDFEKMTPRAPRKLNPEVPPPPPPSLAQSISADEVAEEISLTIPTSEVDLSLPGPSTSQDDDSAHTRRDHHHRRASRFYAVTKDGHPPDTSTLRKRKTRHTNNPPVESHVGWIMDVREHRPRTSSIGCRT